MLVSHDYKFIFLKPGKTAGTSIEVFLEPLCTPPGHTPTQNTPVIETRHGIVGKRDVAPDRSGFFSHILASNLKAALPEKVWRTYTKVASVRNPFDRAISAFHHFGLSRKVAASMDKSEIVEQFQTWVASQNSSRFTISGFTSIRGESCVDFYIRYESMEQSLRDFLVRIGVLRSSLGDLPRLKTNKRAGSIPLVDYYDEASRRTVLTTAAADFDLFGYSDRVEDADLARQNPPPVSSLDLDLAIFRELAAVEGLRSVSGHWVSDNPQDIEQLLQESFRTVRRVKKWQIEDSSFRQ